MPSVLVGSIEVCWRSLRWVAGGPPQGGAGPERLPLPFHDKSRRNIEVFWKWLGRVAGGPPQGEPGQIDYPPFHSESQRKLKYFGGGSAWCPAARPQGGAGPER